jgi:hypothetical protein
MSTTHDTAAAGDLALRRLARAAARWRPESGPEYPESQGCATESVARQMLYERWVGRADWAVRGEALPLLVGVDPQLWERALAEPGIAAAERAVWQIVRADVAAGRLQVNAAQEPPGKWRAKPAALYFWAQSHRHRVPDALEALLQFVLKVVARGDFDARGEPAPLVPGVARRAPAREAGTPAEQLLGAALNVVSKWPDRVRDEHGFIDAGKVVDRIERSARVYFDSDALPMARDRAIAVVDRWLA